MLVTFLKTEFFYLKFLKRFIFLNNRLLKFCIDLNLYTEFTRRIIMSYHALGLSVSLKRACHIFIISMLTSDMSIKSEKFEETSDI